MLAFSYLFFFFLALFVASEARKITVNCTRMEKVEKHCDKLAYNVSQERLVNTASYVRSY